MQPFNTRHQEVGAEESQVRGQLEWWMRSNHMKWNKTVITTTWSKQRKKPGPSTGPAGTNQGQWTSAPVSAGILSRFFSLFLQCPVTLRSCVYGIILPTHTHTPHAHTHIQLILEAFSHVSTIGQPEPLCPSLPSVWGLLQVWCHRHQMLLRYSFQYDSSIHKRKMAFSYLAWRHVLSKSLTNCHVFQLTSH